MLNYFFLELDIVSREEKYTVLHFLALQASGREDKGLAFYLDNLLSSQELVRCSDYYFEHAFKWIVE